MIEKGKGADLWDIYFEDIGAAIPLVFWNYGGTRAFGHALRFVEGSNMTRTNV
ncbi:hypothetical protein Scep_017578 [Stephania cephalantha]|uniref:Uncharacterized protein n=1 Tax=Stephania cephalantha TaxID=152367 RepID=A0AAP0NVT2_9MAGN